MDTTRLSISARRSLLWSKGEEIEVRRFGTGYEAGGGGASKECRMHVVVSTSFPKSALQSFCYSHNPDCGHDA